MLDGARGFECCYCCGWCLLRVDGWRGAFEVLAERAVPLPEVSHFELAEPFAEVALPGCAAFLVEVALLELPEIFAQVVGSVQAETSSGWVGGESCPFAESEMNATLLERAARVAQTSLLESAVVLAEMNRPELFEFGVQVAVVFQAETSSDEDLDEGVLSPFDELEFSATLLQILLGLKWDVQQDLIF